MTHPLLSYYLDAAEGRFPVADGRCVVVPPLADGLECSVGFTGHAVVATVRSEAEVLKQRPDGFGGALAPDFLRWLAGPSGEIGVVDATWLGRGRGGRSGLRAMDDVDHPRVRFARGKRRAVRVFGDERGLVTLSRGLAGRRELSIEVTAEFGAGLGRGLLAEALRLVPDGEPVFAAVSPGNARSTRAFLAVGFVPVGSEVVIRPVRD